MHLCLFLTGSTCHGLCVGVLCVLCVLCVCVCVCCVLCVCVRCVVCLCMCVFVCVCVCVCVCVYCFTTPSALPLTFRLTEPAFIIRDQRGRVNSRSYGCSGEKKEVEGAATYSIKA